MPRTRTLSSGPVSAVEYVCDAVPTDAPYTELHEGWSISYVRRGSFGCQTLGQQHDLVPGSVLTGRPGDEYRCTHDHHICGDECLAFFLAPELVDELTGQAAAWQSGALAALPELMVLGEMAEVGTQGQQFHEEIGAYAAAKGIEHVLATGGLARHLANPAQAAASQESGTVVEYFEQFDGLLAALDAHLSGRSDATVLIKGSRSMKMERAVQHLIGSNNNNKEAH